MITKIYKYMYTGMIGCAMGASLISCSQDKDLGPQVAEAVVINSLETNVGNTLVLAHGLQKQIVTTMHPDNVTYPVLNWRSVDETVATVSSDGLVSGVGLGKTSIIVTQDPAITSLATIAVTVKPVATAIQLQETALYQRTSKQMTVKVTPADGYDVFEWSSSDTSIATVDENGVVKASDTNYGTATITATAESGAKASVDITVGEGTINHNFAKGMGAWLFEQNSSAAVQEGGFTTITMSQSGTNWRGDFGPAVGNNRKPVTLNVGTYRYLAIKMTRPGAYQRNANKPGGTIVLDTSKGRYQQKQGNGNNRYSILGYEQHEEDCPMDQAAMTTVLSVGILCDDNLMINWAISYFKNEDSLFAEVGNVRNAVPFIHQDPDSDEELGQCEESGRDQGHATLCVSLMGAFCQMALNVGEDLFAYDDYRALKMAEYVGKYNLIKDESWNKSTNTSSSDLTESDFVVVREQMPYTAYTNPSWSNPEISAASDKSRGAKRPCWEVFYGYAKANGKQAIYSRKWTEQMRQLNSYGCDGGAGDYGPNSGGFDQLGYGTLMYAR